MTASKTNGTTVDKSTGGTRQLNVTGFGGLGETPTLEVSPTTNRSEVALRPSGGGVTLVVDVFSPGDVRTRATAELFPEQARQLRDDLDAALAEVDNE